VSLEHLRSEQQRVQALAQALAEGRPAAEAARPAATDPTGALLRDVLAWRVQRQEALGAEARRLGREIAAAEGIVLSGAAGSSGGSVSSSGSSSCACSSHTDLSGGGGGNNRSACRGDGAACKAGPGSEGACSPSK
jgi:hypothetical protein